MQRTNQDDYRGLQEGDIVRVVGGLGAIDKLPLANIVALGHAGDNGSPSVMVQYLSCPPGCPGADGKECTLVRWRREKPDLEIGQYGHIQEWYPDQLQKVEP